MDLYTDSASMVSVTSSKSPPRSLTSFSASGVRTPFSNSCNVTNVGYASSRPCAAARSSAP
eukprot:6919367-Lingulodinium_polyedra.AAC.1